MSRDMWQRLVIDSVLRPRQAAQRVFALNLPVDVLVQAGVVVSCLGVVLGYLALRLAPGAADLITAAILGSPLAGALAQAAVMALIVLLTTFVGHLFGGKGGIPGALALVVWLNAVMLLLQAAQLVAFALFPPAAAPIAVVAIVWLLWAYANFVAELHGFQNPALVLGCVVLTVIVLFIVTGMVFALLGVPVQEFS